MAGTDGLLADAEGAEDDPNGQEDTSEKEEQTCARARALGDLPQTILEFTHELKRLEHSVAELRRACIAGEIRRRALAESNLDRGLQAGGLAIAAEPVAK